MYNFRQSGDKYFISIDNHEEISHAITVFCEEQGIKAGSITGIGAVKEATLRFLNPATKKYVDKTFTEQMEIANLTGNISLKDGKTYLHIHITLGRSDYSAVAGHLLTATLNGACELVIERFPGNLGRRFDQETGLNLYNFPE